MPETVHVTTTSDQKPALRQLVRNLPGIIAGRFPDVQGIAQGFKVRIGFKILGLIVPNFDELGRGGVGADGTKWKPLSQSYLAYTRRFGPGEKAALKKKAGLDRTHRFGVGGKKGLLTSVQKKLWNNTYAPRVAFYMMKGQTEQQAKEHAAAVAWIVVKKAGGKTQLEVYGNREVQILTDTGRGRASLTPGQMTAPSGPGADYLKPIPTMRTFREKGITKKVPLGSPEDQTFDMSKPGELIVGTNVGYMGAHHRGNKRLPQRRLWPANFPSQWWTDILGEAISGLVRIGELFRGGKGI